MLQKDCVAARVSAVDRGSYRIMHGSEEVSAELTGRFSFQVDTPDQLPCVGDWVSAQYYDNDTAAVIHRVFSRKSFLRRRSAGARIDLQMVAANIDTAFIVQSCHFDFNPRRLDRYLVMAADGGVEPVILLTKTDLISPVELNEKLEIVRSVTHARVLALSSVTGSGLENFRQILCPGKTCCLLGSSGVGKTTLINSLLGLNIFDTKPVSSTGEGTHTTSRRQLIVLGNGSMLVDTPGMRELGLLDAGEGVDSGFDEIIGLSAQCLYGDCRHEGEPGCAVREAIERGDLSEERLYSYKKLKKESDYYGMSYMDRRKKEKAFGRFIKSYKKTFKQQT